MRYKTCQECGNFTNEERICDWCDPLTPTPSEEESDPVTFWGVVGFVGFLVLGAGAAWFAWGVTPW